VERSYLTAGKAAGSLVPAPRSTPAILFSIDGRIARSTFWLVWIALLCVVALLTQARLGAWPFLALLAPLAWISIAIQSKRWHDRNKSGWMFLISLIPVVGFIWTIVELGCLRGTMGPNRYGSDPIQTT